MKKVCVDTRDVQTTKSLLQPLLIKYFLYQEIEVNFFLEFIVKG